MADPTNRAELREQVRGMYAALERAIAPILPAQMGVPGVNGAWSVKDELAHLAYWHRNLLSRIECATTSVAFGGTAIDDDTWNLRCFVANRDRTPGDISADLWRTQQAILDAIDALPESLLFSHGPHGGALWEAVDGTILGHYPEHIAQIEQWVAQHVTIPIMKSDLLFRIAESYAALTAALDAMPPRELILPGVNGDWAARDELAHITFWEQRSVVILRAARAGEDPPHPPLVGDDAKIDAMNAEVFAASRERRIDDVFADAERTHADLVATITALPDDAIFDPHHFAWMRGDPLGRAVASNTYLHYPEHTGNIRRGHAARERRGSTQ
jgi:hypothetical protein